MSLDYFANDTIEKPVDSVDTALVALSKEDDFQTSLEEVAQKYTQNWEDIVTSASKAAKEMQVDKGTLSYLSSMGLMISSGMVYMVDQPATHLLAVTGFITSVVINIGSVPFVGRKSNAPSWMKKANIAKPIALKARTKVNDNAQVSAVIVSSNRWQQDTEITLGKHDQEEIAKRFLAVKEMCNKVTQVNAVPFDTGLLASHGLSPKGKVLAQQPLQLSAEAQWQEQEQKLLLDANLELASALEKQ